MKIIVRLFILLFLSSTALLSQPFPKTQVLVNARLGLTSSNPTNSEIDANSALSQAFGVDVLLETPLGKRLRVAGGLGVSRLKLTTEINDVLPPLLGRQDSPLPVTVEASANLHYLNVPLQIDWMLSSNTPSVFLRLRSDAMFALGGNSPLLNYTAGSPPFGPSVPRQTIFEQASFAHFISIGAGWQTEYAPGLPSWRFQPYFRFSTLDVLNNPEQPEINNRRNYLRETGVFEFGLSVEYTF